MFATPPPTCSTVCVHMSKADGDDGDECVEDDAATTDEPPAGGRRMTLIEGGDDDADDDRHSDAEHLDNDGGTRSTCIMR